MDISNNQYIMGIYTGAGAKQMESITDQKTVVIDIGIHLTKVTLLRR